MIYLKNISDAQVLLVPKNGEEATGELTLLVRNTIDLTQFSLQVQDLNTSGLYFNLAVVIPEGTTNGEYQYQLVDGNNVLSSGLLIIGDLKTPNQYEKETTYTQYESE